MCRCMRVCACVRTGRGIIPKINAPDWLMVQTQEKGPYRTKDVREFLMWGLPPAACPQESIVVLLDWFSAHTDLEIAERVAAKGHILLFHGGGVTGIEQVNESRLDSR